MFVVFFFLRKLNFIIFIDKKKNRTFEVYYFCTNFNPLIHQSDYTQYRIYMNILVRFNKTVRKNYQIYVEQ